MLTFKPLYWSLIALILTILHPAASHPTQTSKWGKATHLGDQHKHGVRRVFGEHMTEPLPKLSQDSSSQKQTDSTMETQHETNFERGQTDCLYERDTTSEKSIASALIPTSSISQRLYRHWRHPQADRYESPWKTSSAPSTKHYGEVLGQPKKEKSNYIASSSLDLSSGNYISFLSYRISFPFLKSAPVYFPQFPLPGIFTTIMLLLALVWIAILTIGLVEVGTYLWNRGQIAQPAGESDEMVRDNSESRADELIKEPLQVLVSPRVPRCEVVRHQNENVLLSTNSISDSEFNSEVEESRML